MAEDLNKQQVELDDEQLDEVAGGVNKQLKYVMSKLTKDR